jgi:flagellar hook-associated protein 2
VNQASSQLTHILKTGGSGFNSVSVSALAQAGITLDSSGNMQVDNTKLASAIAADPAGVGQLFSNGGSGIVDQMASVAGTLNGASGIVQTGLTTANNDFSKLTTQKATLATAMTAQANALAALYTQQESDAAASSSSGGVSSLFDLMA